jgi:hypothetical protein
MTEQSKEPSGFGGLPKRFLSILVGLVITLVVGAVAERVTSAEWLASAKEAQAEWIDAVAGTSPMKVGELYWTELQSALSGDTAHGGYSGAGAPEGRGLQSPFWALAITGARLWDLTGVVSLIQLALGALAFFVLNFWRTKGDTIFLGDFWISMIVAPIAIVALASLLGWALLGIMMGALTALSWITGLAATAAGATGVAGFCWLCITELTKKGAEHVITPRGLD